MADSPDDLALRKMKTTLNLFGAAENLMRQNLRRQHPGGTTEEIERRLRHWLEKRDETPTPPARATDPG